MDVFDEIAPDVESAPQDVFDLAEQGSRTALVSPPVAPAFVPTPPPVSEAVKEATWKELSGTDKLLASDLGRAGKATISGFGNILEGFGVYSSALPPVANDMGGPYNPANEELLSRWQQRRATMTPAEKRQDVVENPAYQAGGRIKALAEKTFPSIQPESVSRPLGALGEGVGSTVSFLPGALAGPYGVAALGALQNGAGAYEDAIKSGASEDKAQTAFFINAAGGTSEALPIASIFKRLNKATGGSVWKAIKQMAVSGLEEGAQEVFQSVLQNASAKHLYDKERKYLEGVATSGGVGFGVGFLLSALGIGTRRTAARVSEAVELKRENDVFDQAVKQSANRIATMETMPEMAQRAVRRLPRENAPEGAITPEAGSQVQRAIRKRRGATSPAEIAPVKIPDNELLVSIQAPMRLGEKQMPGYVQIDSAYGKENQWSSNPDALRELGYDVPTKDELLTLPQGKYTLKQAKEKLKEIADEKAKPSPEVIAPGSLPVVEGKPVEPVAKRQIEAGVTQPASADQTITSELKGGDQTETEKEVQGQKVLKPTAAASLEAAVSDEYVYHATPSRNASKIRAEGITPGSWFAKTPKEALAFAKDDSNPVIFAVKKSEIKPTQSDADDVFGQEFQKAGVFERSSSKQSVSGELEKYGDGFRFRFISIAPAVQETVSADDVGPRLEGMIQKRLRGEKLTAQQNSLLKRMKNAKTPEPRRDYVKYQQRLAQEQAKKEAEPKPDTPTKLSQEFDRLVAQHGIVQEWVTDPDGFYADIGEGGDTASIEAKKKKSQAYQVARRRAAIDAGLKPDDVDTIQGRARSLAKLKEHLAKLNEPDVQDAKEVGSTDFLTPEDAKTAEPKEPEKEPAEKKPVATGKESSLPEGVTVTRDKDFQTTGNYTVTDGTNTDKIFKDPENRWWYSVADFNKASKTAFPATPLSTENRTEAIQKLVERWKSAEKPTPVKRDFPSFSLKDLKETIEKDNASSNKLNPEMRKRIEAEITARESGASQIRVTPQIVGPRPAAKLATSATEIAELDRKINKLNEKKAEAGLSAQEEKELRDFEERRGAQDLPMEPAKPEEPTGEGGKLVVPKGNLTLTGEVQEKPEEQDDLFGGGEIKSGITTNLKGTNETQDVTGRKGQSGDTPLESSRVDEDLERSGKVLRASSDEIQRFFTNPVRLAKAFGTSPTSSDSRAAQSGAVPVGTEATRAGDFEKSQVIFATVPEVAGKPDRPNTTSRILAHRIIFGPDDAASAGLVGKSTRELLERLKSKLPGLKHVFDELPNTKEYKDTHALYMPSWDAVIINTRVLNNYDLSNPESLAAWDSVLAEELIHAVTQRVTTKSERIAVWQSLTRKERSKVLEAYEAKASDLTQDSAGYEYLRMILQDRLTGETTEAFSGTRITDKAKAALRKIVNFLREAFGRKPANNIARQIIERLEAAIRGEAPIKQSVFEGGEAIRSNINPLKQAVKMAAIDPANAARNVRTAQASAEPVLGFMVREVERLEAIAAQEATTPQQRLVRDVARRTLRGADFRRAIRRKVERFLSSKRYTDDAIATYDEMKAELDVPDATQEQRDKMSNIAGSAVNELVDVENKRTEFNENYGSKRLDLVKKVAASTESEMEAYEKLEAAETLLTDFRQMALPILRQSNDTAALQAYTYALGRTEAVRRVLDFIGREVDLTGATTPQDVERLIREAAGRSRVVEGGVVERVVGASRDVIQAVARIVALVEPIRERLTEARFLYGQQAGTRSTALKQRLEGLVRAGNYARALEVFGRGSEKVGAEHDRAVRELNFYARRTRSALIALRALDETKASLDNIWNDPDFQSKRTEIFNRQGVASVTADLNGTTLVLNAFPGQEKLKLVFGNDVSAEKSTLEQIREYSRNAVAYIHGANPDPSIANGLRATLPLLEQFLNSSNNPAAERLMPNFAERMFNYGMSRFGSLHAIPEFLGKASGGPGRALYYAALRARRDMGEQLQRITREHFPKMGLKLYAALKSHGGITPDAYTERVWNHLAASRQNYRDVKYLSEGDPIGNGERVTKQDLEYLEQYRKFHADLSNTSMNNGKRHFDSFRTVLTGIFFDKNGRVRLPFAHGIDMVNRRAPSNGLMSNWLKAWGDAGKAENQTEAKKAFLDGELNRFVIGYMHGVNQADWVSKFRYSYENQIREVLAESNEQPIDSFDTLVDRVFDKAITEEGEVAPPTREDVEKNLLSDFDAIFKRLARYDVTETKVDPKTSVPIVQSETEFNTERGNVIMPPNWYEYGATTEAGWSSVSRASMFPYERAHMTAVEGLRDTLAEIVNQFEVEAKKTTKGKEVGFLRYATLSRKSRKARQRGELIYSWADAKDLLGRVTHYAGKLRAMAESPMLLTDMDRPQIILQKGGLQVVVSGLLLRIPAMVRNIWGGYTAAMFDDMTYRQMSFFEAVPYRTARFVADTYKNLLALLVHDGNPGGRALHKLLSEASSWNVIGPIAENFLNAVNEQRQLYRDSRELGLSLNVGFKDSLSVLMKFAGTGGTVRTEMNPFQKLWAYPSALLRAAGLTMGQAGVGFGDSWVNSTAYVQARNYEQIYKKMARKYGEQVAALGLNQFPPKAFGGGHRALRVRDYFTNAVGVDIDAAMADYYQRWNEAVQKEKSEGVKEGTYSDPVGLFTEEQRNTLSIATADSFNLATFSNRPYSTKSSNMASILGLFYGWPDWWLHKMLSMANTNSRKGLVAGRLENFPFLLSISIAFAIAAMMKDDGIKWLKEYLLSQKGAYPRITEAKTAKAAVRSAAGALAIDIPVFGAMANRIFDLGYSGGANPYDLILALGVAKSAIDAGIETYQTGDAIIPATRLIDRYITPVPLHKVSDSVSGTRALINTGNILESAVRSNSEEDKLKPRVGMMDRQRTPATPIITRAMNAIGNGDMPEFQKQYGLLVEEYRKQGKSDPERNARQSLMTRNPISQRFARRPSDADFQKYLGGLTPTERKIVTETLENYRQAMGIIGASPSFTAEEASARGGGSSGASRSALPPSAFPAAFRSSGGRRTRSTGRPRRIRGVRTRLTLGRRRTGRIRVRKPRRVRFNYASRKPRRIRISPRSTFI